MSIKSAVTISLVKEAEGGPFVFWHDLDAGCAKAAELGYDAVEVFAPNAATIPIDQLRQLTDEHNLQVAAVGTGGGWVIHKWHLCQPDAASRENAKDFIKGIIDSGAQLSAPAIIGSMQGRFEGEVAKEQAHDYLRQALSNAGFLNIHMKEICQDHNVIGVQRLKKGHHVLCAIQEITFITV